MSDLRDMNLIPIEDAHLASHSEEDARHSADDGAFHPREADVAPQLGEIDGGEQPQHAAVTSFDAPRSTNHSHRTMISSKNLSTTTTTHNSLTKDGDDRSTPKSATNGPSGHGSSFHTTPDKRRSIDLSVATTTGGTNTATSSAQPPPPIQLFGVPHSPVHAGVGRGLLHQSTELLPGEMDGTPTTTTTFEAGGTQSRGSFRSLPSNTALMPTAGLFSVSPGANPGGMLEPLNSGRRQTTDSPSAASTNTEDAGTTPQGFASSSRRQRSDISSRNLRALQASAEEEILTIQNQHRQLEGLVHMVRTGTAPSSSGSAVGGNRSNSRGGGGGASMARSSTYPSSSQAASDPHNSSHNYNNSAHGDSLVFGASSTAGAGLHLAQTLPSLSSHASMDPPPSPAATRGTRKQRRSHHHHHTRDGSIVRSPMPPPYPPPSPQQQPTHRRQNSAQHNDSISDAPVVTPQNTSSVTQQQQQQQQSHNGVLPSPPPSMIPPSSPSTTTVIGMTPPSSAMHVSPQQPAMAVFDVNHRNSSLGGSMLLSDAGSGAASTKKMDNDVTTTPRNPLGHSRGNQLLCEQISPTAASSSLPSGGILSSQQIVASAVLTAFHGTELIQGSESSMVFGQSLVGGGGGGGGGAVRNSMESSQLPNSNTHNMSIYNAIQSNNVSESNNRGGAAAIWTSMGDRSINSSGGMRSPRQESSEGGASVGAAPLHRQDSASSSSHQQQQQQLYTTSSSPHHHHHQYQLPQPPLNSNASSKPSSPRTQPIKEDIETPTKRQPPSSSGGAPSSTVVHVVPGFGAPTSNSAAAAGQSTTRVDHGSGANGAAVYTTSFEPLGRPRPSPQP